MTTLLGLGAILLAFIAARLMQDAVTQAVLDHAQNAGVAAGVCLFVVLMLGIMAALATKQP